MYNIFEICPTHLSRGGEKNFRGGFSPLVPGLLHGVASSGH